MSGEPDTDTGHIRFSIAADVEWWTDPAIHQHGRLLELDMKGGYIETANPCEKDSRITIRFHVGPHIVEIPGLVEHRTPHVNGMGVRLLGRWPADFAGDAAGWIEPKQQG